MSNETTTIKVTATPERLAEQVIRLNDKNIHLMRTGGVVVATIPVGLVHSPHGEELAAVRAWLVRQIEGAYKAGVESVAQTKADGAACLVETYGPDALAKAREEGRRQGWKEATARVERRLTEVQENGVSCDERIDALRSEIEAVEGSRRSIAQKANALRAALAELNADAPKEPA